MEKIWVIGKTTHVLPKKLAEHTKKLGVNTKVLYEENLSIKNNNIYYNGKQIKSFPEVVYLRGKNKKIRKFLDNNNVKIINSTSCVNKCSDKLESHKIMDKNNIPQPRTLFFNNNVSYENVSHYLGPSFVIKKRFSQEGKGVFLIKNQTEYLDVIKKFKPSELIFQEFIKDSAGENLRVYLIGGKATDAMKLISKTDFRSNRGVCNSQRHELTPELTRLAEKIGRSIEGEIIGIDFVLSNNKPLFLEANSSPALCIDMEKSIKKIGDYVASQTTNGPRYEPIQS